MTEADSVHSTPRKTASKSKQPPAPIPFPKAKKPLPVDRPSRLMAVESSGLSLTLVDNDVPAKKAPMTHEQCAAMEFEQWPGKSEGTEALTGENWLRHRVAVVFAHATMFMSKRQLIELHRDVAADQVDELMASILETAEWLKAIAYMMEGAQMRLLVSACAAVDEGVAGNGTLPLNLANVRSTPRLMGL